MYINKTQIEFQGLETQQQNVSSTNLWANDLFFVKDDLINMSRAWNKEKIWVPDRNRTQDLPNTSRVLYPLRSWLLSDDSKSVQKQCSWFVLVKTEKHSDQTTKLSLPRSLWTWFDRHLQHNFGSRVLTRWASRRPVEGPPFKEYCFVFHMLLHKLFIGAGSIVQFGRPLFESWLMPDQ